MEYAILNKDFEPAKNLQLEELNENTCKYMEGHPDSKESSFCGRKNVEKFSYCPLHLIVVFQPRGKKEDLRFIIPATPKTTKKRISMFTVFGYLTKYAIIFLTN